MKKSLGFTLIELIILTVILGIIAGIAFRAFVSGISSDSKNCHIQIQEVKVAKV